jgi:hypothetical protein
VSLGRRALLKASLGLTQAGLLSRLAPSVARAQTQDGPDKLLTLYLPGGWMSLFTFCPLDAAQTAAVIPAPFVESSEPIFFTPSQLQNLDGSSTPGALRLPVLWDEAELSQGRPDRRLSGATSPHGWAWREHRLWENTVAIHGVDQMTAAHVAGSVSALCGVASSEFKSPSLQAWAAHSLFSRFPDRPIPSVWVGGPQPASLDLRSEAAPARISRQADLDFLFSNKLARPWDGLRASDVGSQLPPVTFNGAAAAGGFYLNPIEDRSLRRLRAMKGRLNPASDAVLEKLHDDLVGVSRVLARDVTSIVAATRGVQYTPKPFWAPSSGGHFAVDIGGFGSDSGDVWGADFDLALKLLKSELCTSVALSCLGVGSYGFDNGHSQGHRVQFAQVRGMFDVVGRLLGEMKATPGKRAGKTLLDETLVVLLSDFSRTWPKSGPTSDHWPSNTVIMAGGGLSPNRMIGSYAVNLADPAANGYDGVGVAVQESTGQAMRRPRSSDIITTALAVMGVTNVRIPGGNGEILGVRAGT